MSVTVSYKHPALPDGELVDLYGVGEIKNGGQKTLSDDDVAYFESLTGSKIDEYFKDSENVKLSKAKGGDS